MKLLYCLCYKTWLGPREFHPSRVRVCPRRLRIRKLRTSESELLWENPHGPREFPPLKIKSPPESSLLKSRLLSCELVVCVRSAPEGYRRVHGLLRKRARWWEDAVRGAHFCSARLLRDTVTHFCLLDVNFCLDSQSQNARVRVYIVWRLKIETNYWHWRLLTVLAGQT